MHGDITKVMQQRARGWIAPRADKPAVVAFDVGAHTGIAMVGFDRLAASFGCETKGIHYEWAESVRDTLQRAHGVLHAGKVAAVLVVVEGTFVHKTRSNIRTAQALSEYVGGITTLAALFGFPVWRVQPAEWQLKVLGRADRKQGKRLSSAVARELFGPVAHTEHEADALCLAHFARGAF